MRKRIGIITHYYKSTNYGGTLQAYALCYYLNKNGYDAKQICYCREDNPFDIKKLSLKAKIKKSLSKIKWFIKNTLHYSLYKESKIIELKKREAFKKFQLELTPHTEKEYFDKTLKYLNDEFDFFITGSDQVFNFNYYKYAYWLGYVSKPKISYAASMASDNISGDYKEYIKKALSDFKAIGVREEKTIDLLNNIVDKDITLNVDPTLLLTREEWNEVSSKRLVEENYIFCYFLGDNLKERELAKKYAENNNLRLVCIPSYNVGYQIPDKNYGDYNLLFASPEEFISLIKYANAIFTDSFHASVFSLIYNKQFVVFNRDKISSMNSRVISLMKLFNSENRYIVNENYETVNNILREKAFYSQNKYFQLKEQSISFLKANLGC